MQPIRRGRYEAGLASGEHEVAQAQALRHLAFVATRGRGPAGGQDADGFDGAARHMLIRDCETGALVCCYRMQLFHGPAVLGAYSAQFYDLARLAAFPGPMLELGRFCLHPDCHDPDVLRLAWGAMARQVDEAGVALLFGCSSFLRADPETHAAALACLAGRVAPEGWRPGIRAARALPLAALPPARPDPAGLPPLLRTYLSMGGWVSDHVVLDDALDTLHVLTGVEIARIPPARARALRLIAAESVG